MLIPSLCAKSGIRFMQAGKGIRSVCVGWKNSPSRPSPAGREEEDALHRAEKTVRRGGGNLHWV